MLPIIATFCAIVAGAFVARRLVRVVIPTPPTPKDLEAKVADAKLAAERRVEQAKKEATVVRDEAKQSFAESLDRMALDLSDLAAQLDRRDVAIKTREEAVAEQRKELQARELAVKTKLESKQTIAEKRQELERQVQTKLETRANVDVPALVSELVDGRIQDANLRATSLKLSSEEAVKVDAERLAKRVISISNERFNMSHQPPDRENPGFRLSDPDIIAKITTDLAFRDAFLAATSAEFNVNETGDSVDIRSVDPLKREMARRTLVYMRSQNVLHVDRIQTVLSRVQKELDKELDKAAERAVRLLRIAPLEGEVKRLFSRLLYRASYSQNQWHHAVEVAFVCGMMAAEMGLDVKVARRAGLLHDIGKAMTHDHEGSHALMGADVARRQGESEEVANAIAAHHGEEPNISPYAEITAAGGAISGARPGARREIQEAFNSKVHDLERIAYGVQGVQRVHVMQGGREVRVFVGEREVKANPVSQAATGWEAIYGNEGKNNLPKYNGIKDEDMGPIAEKIVGQIEEELTYPGQIRVTVIRETRAVGTAR